MGDIFREIDEELRQERAEKLWKQYGNYVIGAAVAVVVAIAGYQGWVQYDRSQREAEGTRFAAALAALQDGKTDDARAMFAALGKETSSGYGLLSRLHQGALLIEAGDRAGAIRVYEALAADENADKPIRDLATILSILHGLSGGTPDLGAMEARLRPLAAKGVPWRFSALELLGLVAQRQGKPDEARKHFQEIADDPNAPSGVRQRATQLLDMTKG